MNRKEIRIKEYVTQEYKRAKDKSIDIWQKSFFEHVIRNEKEYESICEYIIYNPFKWKMDEYYK